MRIHQQVSTVLVVLILALNSCKTRECDDPSPAYKLDARISYTDVYSYLSMPENAVIVGKVIYAEVVPTGGEPSPYTYTNPQWTLNGETLDSVSWKGSIDEPGEYQLHYESDCLRKYKGKRECDCQEAERTANLNLEVYDTVTLVISQLNYHAKKGCNYDFPGDGCPDIYIQLPQFDLRNNTTWNYERDETGPILWDSVMSIPVVPEFFELEMKIYDDEFAGNHDLIDEFLITPDMVGNWKSGTYATDLGIDFTIEVR